MKPSAILWQSNGGAAPDDYRLIFLAEELGLDTTRASSGLTAGRGAQGCTDTCACWGTADPAA